MQVSGGSPAGVEYGQPGKDIELGSGPAGTTQVAPGQKSIGELLGDLSRELSELVHNEVQLAKIEITDKAKQLGEGAALLVAGAVAAVAALGALVTCAVAALALVVAVWLAALIVGVVLLGGAGLMVKAGLGQARRGAPPVPQEALESTKEDVAWLQKQIKSAKQ